MKNNLERSTTKSTVDRLSKKSTADRLSTKSIADRLTMKDLPFNEQPYEKLEKYGPDALSNAELLAIIIKTGTKTETSVALAQRILKNNGHNESEGLHFLYQASLEDLRKTKGIGKVKAIQLKAVMTLSKRISSTFQNYRQVFVKTPVDISNVMMEEMRYLNQEVFKALLLNAKYQLLKIADISMGTLDASPVHPREAFSEAIKTGCYAIAFVHNHPSGDPTPSREDIAVTERLVSCGELLGIKVLDHVIIGDGIYTSLKEKNIIF